MMREAKYKWFYTSALHSLFFFNINDVFKLDTHMEYVIKNASPKTMTLKFHSNHTHSITFIST